MAASKNNRIKPILKWAGGKRQLLDQLLPLVDNYSGKYIEPFIGGGALFFALNRPGCVISDINPELINVYLQVAYHPEELISTLSQFENTKAEYYKIRAISFEDLSPLDAAARTIFLNRTCYNGLYRVNKKGQFNVPYGNYKNPKICDASNIRAASELLKQTTIVCEDFESTLNRYAVAGDVVYLDPPYIPVSEYADFKRYTPQQFYQKDQARLSECAHSLVERGCNVVLTNSYHQSVFDLYPDFNITVVPSKRNISSNAKSRRSEDLIAFSNSDVPLQELSGQCSKYPSTRYMGSKAKMIQELWSILKPIEFNTVLDLFSGSGVVSYMLKSYGKQVISNDYMSMSYCFAKSMIENSEILLSKEKTDSLLQYELGQNDFVSTEFHGLYFSDEDNRTIDTIRMNIPKLDNEYERFIAKSALIRACMKKRPRGIFTYTGNRYDDGRADLRKTLEQQFREAVAQINDAVFSNGTNCSALNDDAMDVYKKVDLVYMDPPYYSPHSDNEYVRRYHFVEGLARDWEGVTIQEDTKTKKFKSYPTPFSNYQGSVEAFRTLFNRYRDSIIVVSYSSNSLPTEGELFSLLHEVKQNVRIYPIDHRYSFGTQKSATKNLVKEYVFVGY